MFRFWQNWIRHRTLTFRLSLGILICVSCGIIGLQLFFSEHSKPIARGHIQDLAKHALQEASNTINSVSWETKATALTMKNTLKELEAGDVNMIRNLLRSAVQTLDYDQSDTSHAWIYVFPDGEVKSGTHYSGLMENGEFIFKQKEIDDFYDYYPWFIEVPREETTFWSEPYVDEEFVKKPWVVTCIMPFRFAGSQEINGLVAVSIDLSAVQHNLALMQIQDRGQFLLTSRRGLYMVHPNRDIQLKKSVFNLAREAHMPQIITASKDIENGKSGEIFMDHSTIYNSSVIFFYTPVLELGWGVYLVYPTNIFFAPIRDFQIKTSIASILWLLILTLLISIICHRATKPLITLSRVATSYGRGDFSPRIPRINTHDEIGDLAGAFENMRKNLLQHIDTEKKVAIEQQKSLSELEIATKIQQDVLPKNFPVHPAFEMCASMRAARKVGGDFYDFFFIDDNHFAMLIADVSGKGIPAALFMMTSKALLKSAAESGFSAAEIFYRANNELCDTNKSGMFVSAFLAILNLSNGTLEYVNAGHNPPYIRSDSKEYTQLKVERNFILGGLKNIKFKSQTLKLGDMSRLFLYTDGVTEAQNTEKQFFGDKQLHDILQNCHKTPKETIALINETVDKFSFGTEQSDDITMLELLYFGVKDDSMAVEANNNKLNKVLDFLQKDMKKYKIKQAIQSKFLIAATEIFTNIATHAKPLDNLIRLNTRYSFNNYQISFIDMGKAYDPLKRDDPDTSLPLEQRDIGGLGIFIIKKTMDNVTYEYKDGQNILTISKKLF